MTANDITYRLSTYFRCYRNLVIPNYGNGLIYGEGDLVVVRPSGWAEEIEIKVSIQDLKAEFKNKSMKHRILRDGRPKILYRSHYTLADRNLDEWKEAVESLETEKLFCLGQKSPYQVLDWRAHLPHNCKKYWIALPHELLDKALPLIPEYAGIITLEPCQWNNGYVRIQREAPRLKYSQKVPESVRDHILQCAYYRMWEFEHRQREPKKRAA